MVDVLSPEQRRRCMSRIRGRDTGPELRLRRALWSRGLRYRVNPKLTGKPDVAFVQLKVAIFVDGCFWHGCPQHRVKPRTNTAFWRAKLSRNLARDRKVDRELSDAGWTVIRLWEHQVNQSLGTCVERVAKVQKRLTEIRKVAS